MLACMVGWIMLCETLAGTPATTRPEALSSPCPASQPARNGAACPDETDPVLIRIGDRAVITQSDFSKTIASNPERMWRARDRILKQMVERTLFKLYVEDHPELVPDKAVDDRIAFVMKTIGVASLDDLKQRLAQNHLTLEEYREITRLDLARTELARRGIRQGADEAFLRKLWDTRREEFDGTYVKLRHIMFRVPVYATAAERAAKRRKLEEMRADMLAGRRTWEECVAESDSRLGNGDLGGLTRHGMGNEFLMRVAFKLKPGELSEIVESPLGYHILQVTERVPGPRTFEQSKMKMKQWLEKRGYIEAFTEAFHKYPVVGVNPPAPPTATAPASQPTARFKVPTMAELQRRLAAAKTASTRPADTKPAIRRIRRRPRRGVPAKWRANSRAASATTRPATTTRPAPSR